MVIRKKNDGNIGSGGNMGNDGREQLFWNLNFYGQNYYLYDTNTHDTIYSILCAIPLLHICSAL